MKIRTQNIRITPALNTHEDSSDEDSTPDSLNKRPSPAVWRDPAFEAFHGFEPFDNEDTV
jgi:hypothetical protein